MVWLRKELDSKWFQYLIQFLVIISVGLYLTETDVIKSLNSRLSPPFFLWSERVIASIFTLEYVLRFSVSLDRVNYVKRNRGIIDLLAFLPFWIGFGVPAHWLGGIRACRILRLLKFYRYSPIMQLLGNEFRKQGKVLRTITFLAFTLMLFTSSVGYECEKFAQPDKFGSITGASWWAFISMATIGYGDMSPVTTEGKILGGICMALGLAVFASYLAIFGNIVTKTISEST